MKILIVGGTFDDEGGKSSGLIRKIADSFRSLDIEITLNNGGYFDELKSIMSNIGEEDVVFWMANVPNSKEKSRNIKELYPRKYLVMSKRNNGEYSFQEMINRALGQKANLMLEFTKTSSKISMRVFDPLGTVWCDFTNDVNLVTKSIKKRLDYIMNVTRTPTHLLKDSCPLVPETAELTEFYSLIKNYAETFHSLISPEKGVTRFLGNSSFRCQRGFPSFRYNDLIYVSRRNIDKRYIGKDGFVPTVLSEGNVMYWGNYKPSVDTPIQVRLYNELPNINFMLHSHVYLKDAPYTGIAVPCGALEEVEEILKLIKDRNIEYFEINLIGHGCLVFAKNVEQIKGIEYMARPMPEVI
jgi:hypothetical protein